MRILVGCGLFAATLSFGLGITLPLIHVERLWLFEDEPSLLSMIASLWSGGDRLLAAIVLLFSVIAPTGKLIALHVAAVDAAGPGLPRWFRAIANWSMLDVVLVALVIFAAKTSGLATAVTKPGLWFFAASVAITAALSALVKRGQQASRTKERERP